MKAYDINSKRHILEELIDNALLYSVKWVANRCTSQKPQEPDYMSALSTKFVKDLFNVLVAVFPYYDFSVLGVYCHQKPIVDIKQAKKTELGDILFVYADRKLKGEIVLNSLLLQAKVSSDPCLRVHHSERHQLELYKNWPQFTYCRAGNLNGKKRNILPKTINDGAQYLLIDDNSFTNGLYFRKGMFPMGCAIPDDILCINNSLSSELIDLLKLKSGRTFDSNPHTTEDEWSKMIWDLLKISTLKYSKRKNAQLKSFSRINECSHFCTEGMRDMTLLDEALGNYINIEDISDENCGVSVVLIESRLISEKV